MLCDLVERKKSNLEYGILFLKSLSPKKLYGFYVKWARSWQTCMHSLPERSHTAHMRVPWDRNQRCVRSFFYRGDEKPVFHFPSAEMGFFCEACIGARTRVERKTCTTIHENLRNVFHTPSPHASSSVSRRIPRRLPSMPLESGGFELRVQFSLPLILWKKSLALERVILCSHLFRFHASSSRSTAALDLLRWLGRCK
jgi:hypothetical protein